jgi:hypothetical protein
VTRPPPRSFLLRLWREQAGAPLRATLVSIAEPAAQRHFATLDALCAFLRAQGDEDQHKAASQGTSDCTSSEPQ